MVEGIILTQDEIRNITGLKRYTAQARQLARMGIECKQNAIGELIVSRAHFEQVMGVNSRGNRRSEVKLNLDFFDEKK